ncbi:hypothetical protein L1987_10840 [Smallanthus sonchifolius]|uniref:Uncharacterized protein n=1 Tax=Smallanthus sonchifolius TaxID=185202 RepID=A0ACB9JBI4_9ASTR|nr:hypothetical protein L1987_10840 [Smallanthus sonchifolius]
MEAKKSSKDGVLSKLEFSSVFPSVVSYLHTESKDVKSFPNLHSKNPFIRPIQVFDRDSLIDILLELPLWVPKDEREELKRLEKLVNKYERVLNIELFCRGGKIADLEFMPNLLIPASITSTNDLVVWDPEMGKINPSEHKQLKLVRSLNRELRARRVKTVATAKYHMVATTDGAKFFTWVPSEYYDIRKQCEGCMCYDFSHMENLISKKSVKDAPRVRDIDFVSCSRVVYQAMIMDWTRYLEADIPHLLEDGINLVIRCSYKFIHYIGKVGLQCKDYGFH